MPTALVRPKGMTTHSYEPDRVRNAVLLIEAGADLKLVGIETVFVFSSHLIQDRNERLLFKLIERQVALPGVIYSIVKELIKKEGWKQL